MRRLVLAFNNQEVATLEKRVDGSVRFAYLPTWLQQRASRPVSLSLPLRREPYKGAVVYNFFDNLLPDNDAIRNRIQRQFQVKTAHPFDLLSAIGRDCVGAIQLYCDGQAPPSPRCVEAEPLSDGEIAARLKRYRDMPLGMANTDEGDDFRISIAGAQEKTALLRYQGKWHKPLHATASSHIIKLPIGKLPHYDLDLSESCENEWLCSKIVAAFGLPIARSRIVVFNDVKTLVIKRFDRRWSADKSWLMRLPQEDFCQVLGVAPAFKYEREGGPGIVDISRVLLGSMCALDDRALFLKAQCVFWLLAAIDGHAKNFSVFIQSGGAYRLTPLYDVMSAYPYFGKGKLEPKKIKMAMAVCGKNRHYHWSTIQARHFLSMAKQVGFDEQQMQGILETLRDKVPFVCDAAAAKVGHDFPSHIVNSILEGMRTQAKQIL